MRKRIKRFLALMMALMLVPVWGYLCRTETDGVRQDPGTVHASVQKQQGKTGQSLAEFRETVAVSIGRIAAHISGKISGSAGGRLLPGSGEEKKDGSSTEKLPQKNAAQSKEKYDPYNVYDYDSADDFAEDYVYEFAEEYYDDEPTEDAYDDAYDDACEYWESKHR